MELRTIVPALGAIPVAALRWRKVNVGTSERFASAAAGALLLRWGLRQPPVVGGIAAAVSAALVKRAVLGHCGVYAHLGISTVAGMPRTGPWDPGLLTRFGWKRARLERTVTVARSRAHVFAWWRERGLGVLAPLGALELADARDDDRLIWMGAKGMRAMVLLGDAPAGRGTEVKLVVDDPGRPWQALVRRRPDAALRDRLRWFKQVMEAGEQPIGAVASH